ncbi:hypothetical protein O9929_16785 [Vibrio lentus]|nr:hypothetical protein [Vibrio lentus]
MLHTLGSWSRKRICPSIADPEFFLKNILVNTLPSLLLAKHFTPILKASDNPKFAVVSAQSAFQTPTGDGMRYRFQCCTRHACSNHVD